MPEFFFPALLALALGGLIGLERERSGHPLMGVRSFALCGLLGFLATVLPVAEWAILIGFAGIFLLSALVYHLKSERRGLGHGITTIVMLPLTFLFGVLVGLNLRLEAAAVAIVVTFLLAEKSYLHHVAKMVTREELTDLLVFAVLAFIAHPFIPKTPVVILGSVLSLQYVWEVITLITAISFCSHVLLKFTKERGAEMAALLGAAVSSLATLALFSHKIKDEKHLLSVNLLVSAGTIAGSLVVLLIVAPGLFEKAFIPLSLMGVVFLGAYMTLGPRLRNKDAPVEAHAFSLAFIAKFTAVFVAVGLIFNLPHTGSGLLAYSFLGGLLSSTSVLASLGYLHLAGQVSTATAIQAAIASLIASSLAKSALTVAKYPRQVELWTPAVLAVLSGAIGWFLFQALG
ncbi:MgtC/SapB family protein [Candidatus Micrarchaeota archaeon]|nr:MgtC/SapB family protein [Candidatus Micrarchaeota archaeon]